MKQLFLFFAFCIFIVKGHSQDADHANKLGQLDFIIGDWKLNVDTRLSSDGPWERTEGRSKIRKTLNEALIEEEFTGTRENKPFLTKTLFALNSSTNKYQRVFVDSEHGVLIEFEGAKNKDTIYFDRQWVYTNGSTVKLRVAYYILSKDEFFVESMRMPQQSTKWDITGRMRYKRID